MKVYILPRSLYQLYLQQESFPLTLVFSLYGALASIPSLAISSLPLHPFMASIDAVTASFAASLALASGGSAPDLGKIGGGPVRKSSQSFLLGKPLTRKPVDPKAFKAHFHRTWMVDKDFRVQEKAGDVFLFSFESLRDRNKILRGGVWSFDRAPVCFEIYDGVKPLHEAQFKHLRVWVRVLGIPPLYEEPENFTLIGNLLGGFLDYDKKEFKKGGIRIFFTHDISKPFLLERKIFLDVGVESVLQFQFEHLKGRCSQCGLVTHSGIACEEPHTPLPSSRVLNFPGPSVSGGSFSFSAQNKREFFTASSSIPKKKNPTFRRVDRPNPPSTSPFGSSPVSDPADGNSEHITSGTEHALEQPLSSFLAHNGANSSGTSEAATLVQDMQQDVVASKKRDRIGGCDPSPKKFKTIMGGKIPTLQADALGLVGDDHDFPLVTLKKKMGRPLGSRNKSQRSGKKAGAAPLRLTYPAAGASGSSPRDKGKGKL